MRKKQQIFKFKKLKPANVHLKKKKKKEIIETINQLSK